MEDRLDREIESMDDLQKGFTYKKLCLFDTTGKRKGVKMNRLILVKPDIEYIDEIRSYRQEFIDNGSLFAGDSALGSFYDDIEAWILQCKLMENKETKPKAEWVEADQFMLVREGERRVLGMINLRHYLNDSLAEIGGHIGYSIRPSERRKGYAKIMLSLCLDECRKLGIEQVLITCDAQNEASYRTIEACGGKFDRLTVRESNAVTARYWVSIR